MRGLVQDMDALGTQGYSSLPLREFAPLVRNEHAGVAARVA